MQQRVLLDFAVRLVFLFVPAILDAGASGIFLLEELIKNDDLFGAKSLLIHHLADIVGKVQEPEDRLECHLVLSIRPEQRWLPTRYAELI